LVRMEFPPYGSPYSVVLGCPSNDHLLDKNMGSKR
jgi:hypothetical protein